ncbi:MAG: hybrid sensor histidine kinase/response regulator, partial [Planctomycetota bacterium]
DGTIEAMNRTVAGISMEEAIGSSVYEYVPPEQMSVMKNALEKVYGEGEIVRYEIMGAGPHGARSWYETRAIPVKDGETVKVATLISTDITKRKQAEAAFRESEERWRFLATSIPDLVVTVSREGTIRALNRTVTGEPIRNRIGAQVTEFVPPAAKPLLMKAIEDVFDTRKSHRLVTEGMGPGGAMSWYEARIFPVIREGVVVSAMIIARDITKRRRAEEARRKLEAQIQHAQKLESLAVLAGGVAHDFNNILTGLLGHVDLAMEELPSENPAHPFLQQIETASNRLADLTNQMLAYSGKGVFKVESINLSQIVEEMTHLLEVSISKKVRVQYEFARKLPLLRGDATQIRQVALNLITNAAEAIGEGPGSVMIRTGLMKAGHDFLARTYINEGLPEGEYVFLEVADTGCGMDSETEARLFDPFFTTKQTGRGLGLAAALGIVRGHRGAIRVDSEIGQGTTVQVLFPPGTGPVAPEEPEIEDPGKARMVGTVLVVDDEEGVRSVARLMLENGGFTVLTANDGLHGLDVFEKNQDEIVAVLLDLSMPRMTGPQTFREMKRLRSDIPVILISGYTEPDVRKRFSEKGLAGFIQKPFKSENLLATLASVLEPGNPGPTS